MSLTNLSDDDRRRWSFYNLNSTLDDIYGFLAGQIDEQAITMIRERLSHCRCLLLDPHVSGVGTLTFVDVGSLFLDIETDCPPFAYNTMNLVRGARSRSLLELLGVASSPTDESIVNWLASIQRGDAATQLVPAATQPTISS